jgi:hypothetical protein
MLVQFSCGSGVSMSSSNLKEEVHIGCLEFFRCLLINSLKIFLSVYKMCYIDTAIFIITSIVIFKF